MTPTQIEMAGQMAKAFGELFQTLAEQHELAWFVNAAGATGRKSREGSRADCRQRMTEPPAQRVVFVVRLAARPGVDAIKQLRLLLKRLLRTCGLRCVSIEEERDGQ
jgi:hypothetical protein